MNGMSTLRWLWAGGTLSERFRALTMAATAMQRACASAICLTRSRDHHGVLIEPSVLVRLSPFGLISIAYDLAAIFAAIISRGLGVGWEAHRALQR